MKRSEKILSLAVITMLAFLLWLNIAHPRRFVDKKVTLDSADTHFNIYDSAGHFAGSFDVQGGELTVTMEVKR